MITWAHPTSLFYGHYWQVVRFTWLHKGKILACIGLQVVRRCEFLHSLLASTEGHRRYCLFMQDGFCDRIAT